MITRRWLAAALSIALALGSPGAAWLGASRAEGQQKEFKVGVALSLSGIFSKDAGLFKEVYDLWADTVNKAGGIKVKGTGYMPPNSVPANDPKMLKPFYETRPNHLTSLAQQPFMTAWYAFPGENNLKIIATIKDRLQTVVDKSAEPKAATPTTAEPIRA